MKGCSRHLSSSIMRNVVGLRGWAVKHVVGVVEGDRSSGFMGFDV